MSRVAMSADVRLVKRARGAHERLKDMRRRNRRKKSPWRDESLDALFVPTETQWRVLFALEVGPLHLGHFTTPGASVAFSTARSLQAAGLVTINEDRQAELTDAGRERAERAW